ncbi:MAG: 8-oxo-dGTP diphosphatase [Clostridia bacterium]|nr:8-oxo-dGTP diphosphatase [Clostridia bacterium]
MACIEKVIFTNMCMIEDDQGRVVVQKRLDPSWPGLAFPGGHVEPGESFTQAVVREVQEETGLVLHGVKLCGVKHWPLDDGTRYMVLLYKADQFTGALQSSSEGEVMWVAKSELPHLPLARGLIDTLQIFEDDSLTEHYYVKEDGKYIGQVF